MDPIIAGLIGTLITAIASISIALIQARSSKSQEKPSGILIPQGAKLVSANRSRKTIFWIAIFVLTGGIVGYVTGGGVINISRITPASPPTNTTSPLIIKTPTSPVSPQPVLEIQTSDSTVALPTETSSLLPISSNPEAPTVSGSVNPSNALGKLLVRIPEACKNKSFEIKSGNLLIGIGEANSEMVVGAGVYDIVFISDFNNVIQKSLVKVQEGQDVVVDLTNDLSSITLTGYPELDKSLLFFPNTTLSNKSWLIGEKYCATPGIQTITLISSHLQPGYLSSVEYTYGLFENSEMTFQVTAKSTELTILTPEQWSKQLGIMVFNPPIKSSINFKVINLQTGIGHDYYPYQNLGYFWMPVGIYKIIFSNPYPGLTFDRFEINPGKETILNLPN